jgi:hypothetical protein
MAAKFKRSSDFSIVATYTPGASPVANLIGYTATSQLLDYAGVRHDLTASINGAGLVVTLTATAAQTEGWAVGQAQVDIRCTNGTEFLTDTLAFPIIPEITKR